MVVTLGLFLVLYNNLVGLLPEDIRDLIYVPLNLGVGFLLVLWVRRRGVSYQEMGFSREALHSGVRWGLLLGIALPAPLFLALVLPDSVSSLLEDKRLEGVGAAGLAYTTLVRIPLGTALFEEVAFRGLLYGVWAKAYGMRSAILGSSLLFGLWHVRPTLELLEENDRLSEPALMALGVLGGVAATFLGGLFFAWIRWRTRGVYGPVLTHWPVNALAATAAFLALR